jgi:hypothetical protein
MTESARNLAGAVALAPAGSSLRDPGVAAILAAMVGGMHGEAVLATLGAAKLAPLSAVYSTVWGSGDATQAAGLWAAGLAAGEARGGGGGQITAPLG